MGLGSSHQSLDDVQSQVHDLLQGEGRGAPPAVNVRSQIPDHDLLHHKQIGRAHAAAVHAHDVGVVQAGHDLQLMLRMEPGAEVKIIGYVEACYHGAQWEQRVRLEETTSSLDGVGEACTAPHTCMESMSSGSIVMAPGVVDEGMMTCAPYDSSVNGVDHDRKVHGQVAYSITLMATVLPWYMPL